MKSHASDTSRVIRLTKAAIDRAKPVHDQLGNMRQAFLWDSVTTGFGVRVGSRAKTFLYRKTVRGTETRIDIGRYGTEWTLEQARKEADRLRVQLADGHNPRAGSKFTLRDAWALYQSHLEVNHRSERTRLGYDQCLNKYLNDWLDVPLKEIDRARVRDRHKGIAKKVAAGEYAAKDNDGKPRRRDGRDGKVTADAVMHAFRAIWNRARRQHPELPECPTANVDWWRVRNETPPLSVDELKVWHAAVLESENPIRRDCLLLMLFTGLRVGTARTVRWEDVDLEARKLRIPRPKGGTKRAFDLPLTPQLVALLKQRGEANQQLIADGLLPEEAAAWVFPSTGKAGHIVEVEEAIDGLDWKPHQLRSTFITYAAKLDVSPYKVKLLVNHALPSKRDVTAGYTALDVDDLRVPMQLITDRIVVDVAPTEPTPTNVLPMRHRKRS